MPNFPAVRPVLSTNKYVSGEITLNSLAWANVPGVSTLVVTAKTGDVLMVSMNMRLESAGNQAYFDVATEVGGSVVNVWCTGNTGSGGVGDLGVPSLIAESGRTAPQASVLLYTVVAGDVSGGTVTLRLRYKTATASNRTLNASTVVFIWQATNLSAAG
jgi:hypothetical protein